MNKNITSLFLGLLTLCSFTAKAQWSKTAGNESITRKSDNSVYYKLDMNKIRMQLLSAQKVGDLSKPVTIEIPNAEGKMERFAVNSFPVFDEAVAAQYQLGSYVGTGIDDPSKYIRFSVAPNDFQSMMISNGKYEFIEAANGEKSIYSLHSKTSKEGHAFACKTKEGVASVARLQKFMDDAEGKSNNKKFHTLRLAMAVTGEYTTYFNGTAGALAQINATMTRVNGVFEQEFNLHLNVINAPNLIFTDAATDPFSPASEFCKWNYELMNTLHNGAFGVNDNDFDIGHLFGATGGGGNAGCIGCIGSNDTAFTSYPADPQDCGYAYLSPDNYKGSGITSPADNQPFGDNFDIDYVAHEMGHQLGDSHTYSFYENYLNKEMEPGSGSTIMGYAGITGSTTDVQAHSDPYFHSVSIDQVQAVLAATSVDVETPISNNPPVITPMSTTYTIPKGTAFVLTAVATDPDMDALTYSWEQVDYSKLSNGVTKSNIGNTASGASFRSLPAVSSPTRYFPKLSTVLGGAVKNTADFEAASTVARTTNFRVTVRDNKIGGQAQTVSANQVVVVGAAAAFKVNAASGAAGSPVNVTWVVSGTTAAPYNVANVKIDYTTDNGATWTVLSASAPNNGTAAVTFPSSLGASTPYVRVSAIGNVFYAVNKVTLTAALATSEIGKNIVQIYPNPATDVLFVKNISAKSTYTIYDATGRLVAKGQIDDGEINVSSLLKGSYVISFANDGSVTKTKFIKK
ncbi:T9SS type A sorting domain-containing protein [Kaistella sp. DKR-2]|uniref:zinc-dependent metalloprotease n=1 Tax=Kaistella soli TaxID=2849654 RepID=UPI001C27AAE0|nr:zinc-dependent metalloprotease [Kaistella soli]MBU8883233.1 T9SS type A sorting domain-containing protein [Kaistella soli]